MNSISLHHLWDYLQGLSLTSNNKKWLADHLYASAESQEHANLATEWPCVTDEDLVLSPEILSIVQDIDPLPDDFDIDNAKLEYLKEKLQ